MSDKEVTLVELPDIVTVKDKDDAENLQAAIKVINQTVAHLTDVIQFFNSLYNGRFRIDLQTDCRITNLQSEDFRERLTHNGHRRSAFLERLIEKETV